MLSRTYNIIVPRLDFTGPTNLALDLAKQASKTKYKVNVYYFSGDSGRLNYSSAISYKKISLSSLFSMTGLVHSHGLRPDIFAFIVKLLNPKVKIISTLHGHFPHHLNFNYPRFIVAFSWFFWSKILMRFDNVVCISNTMFRFYRRTLPKLSCVIIYNCRSSQSNPDEEVFDTNLDTWLLRQRKGGKIVMAFVGSLCKRKNLSEVLKVLAHNENFSLIVCGDGPGRNALLNLIDSNKSASDRFLYLGFRKYPECIIAKSDILVLPSRAEGFPLVVLESAMVKKCVLMSNIAVHREIKSLGFGDVFLRNNTNDFCLKAEELVRRDTRPNNINNVLLSNFSVESIFSKYEKIFNRWYK